MFFAVYCVARSNAQQEQFQSGLQKPSVIVRDAKALVILTNALNGMSKPNTPPIADYSISGNLTLFHGQSATGSVSQHGIGVQSRSTSVKVDSSQGYRILSNYSSGSVYPFESTASRLPSQVAFEHPFLLPLPLLEDAISNPQTGVVEVQDKSSTSEFGPHLQITRHSPDWTPALPQYGAVTLDVLLDPSGTNVARIWNMAHYDSNLRHTIPHSVDYSDFAIENGWLVPHTISESYAGRVHLRYTITSFIFNSGLAASEFIPQ
jgi:hypothetical protein